MNEDPVTSEPLPKGKGDLPEGWAWAFLWMPASGGILFMAAQGPSATDDKIMWLWLLATPIVCGIAVKKVTDSNSKEKKIWARLNMYMCIVSALALAGGIVAGAMFASAFRS
jgi:hypothetical protein